MIVTQGAAPDSSKAFLGGLDNLLSRSRSDKRSWNEGQATNARWWGAGSPGNLLRLRRPDNKLSGPPEGKS
jgi:hypothetical protein